MKRSDFLKRIGLAVGAIAALPVVALKAMRKPTLPTNNPPILPTWMWERWKKDREFREGTQWTLAQTKILEAQRRHPLNINTVKIKAAITSSSALPAKYRQSESR